MASSKDPKPGDLIEIPNHGYGHWAVYVGGGYVVHLVPLSGTHFSSSNLTSSSSSSSSGLNSSSSSSSPSLSSGQSNKAIVMKDKLSDVVNGKESRVNNYLDKDTDPIRSPEEIVNEAEELVGEELPYSLIWANCEHFATKLRYGNAVSKQVRDTVLFVVCGWPLNKVADRLIPR